MLFLSVFTKVKYPEKNSMECNIYNLRYYKRLVKYFRPFISSIFLWKPGSVGQRVLV